MLSNSFAGIAPSSVPLFVLGELGGGLVGLVILRALYPSYTSAVARSVTPHVAEASVDDPMIEKV